MTLDPRLRWFALWLFVGALVWLLVLRGVAAIVASDPPQWTPPPSAIVSLTAAPGLAKDATTDGAPALPAPSPAPGLPRGTGAEADHEAPAGSRLPTRSAAALSFVGIASYYDAGPGWYAALPGPWRAGRWVRVCGMAACVTAPVVTTCGCAGPPRKVIDLSPALWQRVSGLPLSYGITSVSIVIGGKP